MRRGIEPVPGEAVWGGRRTSDRLEEPRNEAWTPLRGVTPPPALDTHATAPAPLQTFRHQTLDTHLRLADIGHASAARQTLDTHLRLA